MSQWEEHEKFCTSLFAKKSFKINLLGRLGDRVRERVA